MAQRRFGNVRTEYRFWNELFVFWLWRNLELRACFFQVLSTVSEGNDRENIGTRGKSGAQRVTRATLGDIGNNVGTSIHDGKVSFFFKFTSQNFVSAFQR